MSNQPSDRAGRDRRQEIEEVLLAPFDFLMRHRVLVKSFLHLGIFVLAYVAAWLIRFEFSIPPQYVATIRETLLLLLAARAIGFLAFGLFRGWWRYVSITDILPIGAGCTLGTVLFVALVALSGGSSQIPRSIYVLDLGNTLMLVLGARYLIRATRENFLGRRRATDRHVLIVGAGAAGQMIAREIRENRALGIFAVGFIDDDRAKIGTSIQGLRILGGHEKIEEFCSAHKVNEVIIAIPSAPASVIRHIVEHLRNLPARFRILPGVGELVDGRVSVRDLRNVRLADLLGGGAGALDTEPLRPNSPGAG